MKLYVWPYKKYLYEEFIISSSILPIIKGGGAKTYLEKRENIFIKGGRIQRGKNTFKFSFNCNIYLYYFHFFEPTMSINIAQYTPKYRQRGFDNWFQYLP